MLPVLNRDNLWCSAGQILSTMTAFDLVSLSHRDGGAWSRVFDPHADRKISSKDIIDSVDFKGIGGVSGTFEAGMRGVMRAIPNALMMLENS